MTPACMSSTRSTLSVASPCISRVTQRLRAGLAFGRGYLSELLRHRREHSSSGARCRARCAGQVWGSRLYARMADFLLTGGRPTPPEEIWLELVVIDLLRAVRVLR